MIHLPHTRVAVRYEMAAIRDDCPGYVRPVAKGKNLITDAGLDACHTVATNYMLMLWSYFRLGTGNTPNNRAGGAITFSRTGNTITASSAFFESADSGRRLVCTAGEELLINGYTSQTQVSTATAGADFAGLTGTVYYTNQTALASPGPLASFSEVAVGTGFNGTTYDLVAGTQTAWVTRVSGTALADTLYTEIGWAEGSGMSPLVGRALINGGSGDTLLAGERYRVKVTITRTVGPLVPTVSAPLAVTGITGVDVQWLLEGVSLSYFLTSGSVTEDSEWYTEPTGRMYCALTNSTTALRTPLVRLDLTYPGTKLATAMGTLATYISGSFTRQFSFVWASNTAAFSGVRSICIGGNTGYDRCGFRGLLSAPIAKTTEQRLSITFARSFRRYLTP